jgi:succinate dehydrogenase/fumarate reductase-like Fe-S protein
MTQQTVAPVHEAPDHEAADRPIREIERLSEQNLWACYQCGRCTADCPFSLTPSLAVRLLQLGQLDDARALATTWDCASCYSCQTGCPKGVSPARLMKALRALDGAQRGRGVLRSGSGSPLRPSRSAGRVKTAGAWPPSSARSAFISRAGLTPLGQPVWQE